MDNKRYCIKLTSYERVYDGENKIEVDNENSWIISYKKDENCYLCERISNNKITKMENVEKFIRVWNQDMNIKIYSRDYRKEAKISIFIENEYYSGYICSRTSKIPVDIIPKYICILKDIIEEKDKDDKTAEEDYSIIQL